jgi:maltooligosyltrehalose trehalohydrolase
LLGAIPNGEDVEFSVWAPAARSLGVRAGGETYDLARGEDGVYSARLRVPVGTDYVYVLDGGRALPDPCSRCQPEAVRGPSRVVALERPRPLGGLSLEELVVYELHVGTFTDDGTFDAVAPYLRALRELGVTAIEPMPVATFPGERGWGYDGVYAYAPHRAYGGPDGLARLVDAAHAEGLGVILDVVYNHIGPGSEQIGAFGPYFTDRHETFWGDAIGFTQRGVREWAIQNALMWVRDYAIDGLRLDATHAIFDDESPVHVLKELRDRVKAESPRALVIAEMEVGNERPIREWGHDAQWADELHHALHALLTGERDGYYANYGRVEQVAEQLARAGPRLVVCAQNHDQVGNRALGDRLPTELLRVASAVVLFSPATPLLFMGEEYGEPNPFQFFTDHLDPAIAEATREGRKREFAAFGSFSHEEIPDPQDPATFVRSKLSRLEQPGVRDHYRRLLSLRRTLPREVAEGVEGQVLRARRGDAELVVDFGRKSVELRA